MSFKYLLLTDDSNTYEDATAPGLFVSGPELFVIRVATVKVLSFFLFVMLLHTFFIAAILWPYFGLIQYARKQQSVPQDLQRLLTWHLQLFRSDDVPSNSRMVKVLDTSLERRKSGLLFLARRMASQLVLSMVSRSMTRQQGHGRQSPRLGWLAKQEGEDSKVDVDDISVRGRTRRGSTASFSLGTTPDMRSLRASLSIASVSFSARQQHNQRVLSHTRTELSSARSVVGKGLDGKLSAPIRGSVGAAEGEQPADARWSAEASWSVEPAAGDGKQAVPLRETLKASPWPGAALKPDQSLAVHRSFKSASVLGARPTLTPLQRLTSVRMFASASQQEGGDGAGSGSSEGVWREGLAGTTAVQRARSLTRGRAWEEGGASGLAPQPSTRSMLDVAMRPLARLQPAARSPGPLCPRVALSGEHDSRSGKESAAAGCALVLDNDQARLVDTVLANLQQRLRLPRAAAAGNNRGGRRASALAGPATNVSAARGSPSRQPGSVRSASFSAASFSAASRASHQPASVVPAASGAANAAPRASHQPASVGDDGSGATEPAAPAPAARAFTCAASSRGARSFKRSLAVPKGPGEQEEDECATPSGEHNRQQHPLSLPAEAPPPPAAPPAGSAAASGCPRRHSVFASASFHGELTLASRTPPAALAMDAGRRRLLALTSMPLALHRSGTPQATPPAPPVRLAFVSTRAARAPRRDGGGGDAEGPNADALSISPRSASCLMARSPHSLVRNKSVRRARFSGRCVDPEPEAQHDSGGVEASCQTGFLSDPQLACASLPLLPVAMPGSMADAGVNASAGSHALASHDGKRAEGDVVPVLQSPPAPRELPAACRLSGLVSSCSLACNAGAGQEDACMWAAPAVSGPTSPRSPAVCEDDGEGEVEEEGTGVGTQRAWAATAPLPSLLPAGVEGPGGVAGGAWAIGKYGGASWEEGQTGVTQALQALTEQFCRHGPGGSVGPGAPAALQAPPTKESPPAVAVAPASLEAADGAVLLPVEAALAAVAEAAKQCRSSGDAPLAPAWKLVEESAEQLRGVAAQLRAGSALLATLTRRMADAVEGRVQRQIWAAGGGAKLSPRPGSPSVHAGGAAEGHGWSTPHEGEAVLSPAAAALSQSGTEQEDGMAAPARSMQPARADSVRGMRGLGLPSRSFIKRAEAGLAKPAAAAGGGAGGGPEEQEGQERTAQVRGVLRSALSQSIRIRTRGAAADAASAAGEEIAERTAEFQSALRSTLARSVAMRRSMWQHSAAAAPIALGLPGAGLPGAGLPAKPSGGQATGLPGGLPLRLPSQRQRAAPGPASLTGGASLLGIAGMARQRLGSRAGAGAGAGALATAGMRQGGVGGQPAPTLRARARAMAAAAAAHAPKP